MRAGGMLQAQLQQPCSVRAEGVRRPALRPARGACQRVRNWKTFGPTAEHSDGDADFYRTTSRLADQYEWFAPKDPQEEAEQPGQHGLLEEEDTAFGLSPRQIAALGLSGPRSSLIDSVSGVTDMHGWSGSGVRAARPACPLWMAMSAAKHTGMQALLCDL